MTPPDRLIAELCRVGVVFCGHRDDGATVLSLGPGLEAVWHGGVWRVGDAVYPPGREEQVARRLATQAWPAATSRG